MSFRENMPKYKSYQNRLSELPKELKPIVDVFYDDIEKSNGKLDEILIEHNSFFVRGTTGNNFGNNELLLRLGDESETTLTIARVSFVNRRKGYFTKLLSVLNEFGKENGFDTIRIEAISSKEMEAYVMKNEFELEPIVVPTGFEHIFRSTNWLKQIK